MQKARRNTQEELIMLKKNVLDKFIAREISRKDVATLLGMHKNAVSRLKTNYIVHGVDALVPAKPGPKEGSLAVNRTSEEIEDVVIGLALQHPFWGPDALADELLEIYGIKINQSTVWRILGRTRTRYTRKYKREKKDPRLYCLDKPGIELQMDGCYPFGRQRKLVEFDAIDDCSRYVYARIYNREDADSAIDFVSHLVKNIPFRIERIRVDNRYDKKFKEYCESIGIEVIANDPYTPEQNGKIERFHRTVKREFYWRRCGFHDSDEYIAYKLSLWVGYYNTGRRHSGYGMNKMTPSQKIYQIYINSLPLFYPQKVTSTLQQYII